MFEMTSPGNAPVQLRVSFWQAVKAGIGFTLGAALLLPIVLAVAGILGGSWITLLSLLTRGR